MKKIIRYIREAIDKVWEMAKRPESFWLIISMILVFVYEVLVLSSWYPLQRSINQALDLSHINYFWLICWSVLLLSQSILYFLIDSTKYNYTLDVEHRIRQEMAIMRTANVSFDTHASHAEQIVKLEVVNSASGAIVASTTQLLPAIVRTISLLIGFSLYNLLLGFAVMMSLVCTVILTYLMLPYMRVMAKEFILEKESLTKEEILSIEKFNPKYFNGREKDHTELIMASEIFTSGEKWHRVKWNMMRIVFYLSPALVMISMVSIILYGSGPWTVGSTALLIGWSAMYYQHSKEMLSIVTAIVTGEVSSDLFKTLFKNSLQNSDSTQPANIDPAVIKDWTISVKDLQLSVRENGSRKIIVDLKHMVAKPGEIVLIKGPNGSGKTTFLRILSTVFSSGDNTFSGEVKIGDRSIKDLDSLEFRKNYLAACLPEMNLFRGTVRGNLLEFQEVDDLIMAKVLQLLNFDPKLLDKEVGEFGSILSLGMAAKVCIARTLLKIMYNHHIKLVVMDEPEKSLDDASAEKLVSVLQNFAKDYGVTLIITTHSNWFDNIASQTVSL